MNRMLYKKYLFPILILLISIFALLELFKPGLPITHDGQDHVARIANFYQNLSEGNIVPRWAGNLNWGYGHPILEFLYPLPSYFASIFHFLGFSLVDSVKLVFGASFILSGLTMYIFIKELLNDDKTAFLGSILYIIAPYRFVDLYVRGAIGEHVAFIFPPIIFYFLLRLSKNYSFWNIVLGAFSFAGLNLAHNAISLMFLPLFGAYTLFLLFQSKKKTHLFIIYFLTACLGFGLSAFFWLPAFVEGKYTLRDIVTGGGEYVRSFVGWKDFLFSEWNYGGSAFLSKQIGILHWFAIFVSIFSIYKLYEKRNKMWILGFGSLTVFIISLFLMTTLSNPIWQTITILQKFQFPWRFLSIVVFIAAFLGSLSFNFLQKKYKKLILLIVILILLFLNKDYWQASGFLQKGEDFYKGIYNSTTDTGESAPIWSVRFMEKRPKSKVEIIEGKAQIQEVKRNITIREYIIKAENKSRILENTLYFPGWFVFIDGKQENIQFQDPNYRGLITFFVDKGEHNVNIIYKDTKIRSISNIISLFFLIIFLIFGIFKLLQKRMYNK